jgi:undecaprenyl-diphosphatase
MESFFSSLTAHLPSGPIYYLLIFAAALLESIVLLGLLVPGSMLIALSGFLAAHGHGNLAGVMAAAGGGALLGDLVSYLIGSRLGSGFLHRKIVRKKMHLIRKGEMFFLDHGGKSLFFGRFTGPLRGLLPFVAGCARMAPVRFLACTLASCLLWGMAYPGVGVLGAAGWQAVQQWSGRLSLLIVTLLVLLVINSLLWKRLVPRLIPAINAFRHRCQNVWSLFLQRPLIDGSRQCHPRLWRFLAARLSLRHGSGLYLTIGLLTCALFAGLFFWLLVKLPLLNGLDHGLYHLLAGHRHVLGDRIMLLLTSLADGPVLAFVTLWLTVWLTVYGRNFSAVLLIGGMAGGHGLIGVLKQLFSRARPEPFLPSAAPASFGFPSGHAFFSLLLAGLAVYFLLGSVRQWQARLSLVMSGSFAALLIGASRLFLGTHWFSDVLAGWLLACVWLAFLLTALEVRRRLAGEFPWRSRWRPPALPRRVRAALLTIAASLAAFGIIRHVLAVLGYG